MAGRDVNVQMGLTSVDEVSFMMLPGKVTENVRPGNIKLGFFNQIQPEVESDKIALIFGVRYELEDDKILECVYRFEFRVNGLDRFITTHDKEGITVTYIMPLLINVAIGTMRGILVVKTAGTNLSKYPLPIIDSVRLTQSLSNP